jgi:RNA polymerase sigma-70 factor (ECF subfamily)
MSMHPSVRQDPALFREWLQLHAGVVWKVARAFTQTPADQEDLTQEILLQVWSAMPRFEGKAKVSTWIYRIALNTALVWQRKERKRSNQIPLLEIEDLPGGTNDPSLAQDRELVEALYAAIRRLTRIEGALLMMYLDDLSYREMAKVLGISEDYVGVKLNRAKRTLTELMKEVAHESR